MCGKSLRESSYLIDKKKRLTCNSILMNVVESNWNDILMEFIGLTSLMKGLSLA